MKAEGQSKAFDLINASFTGNAQLLKQFEVTQASLENNSKIVLTEKGIKPQIIMDAIPIKHKKDKQNTEKDVLKIIQQEIKKSESKPDKEFLDIKEEIENLKHKLFNKEEDEE